MQLDKIKLALFAIIILVILALILSLILSLFSGTVIQQNIVFEDMTITKTISLNAERTETYEFELTNPIIGYLVTPKTISENASKILITGNFQHETIEEDSIIKIISKDFFPGTKKLIITTPIGDTNQTTILFPFPLAEYNTLTDNEKQQLEDTVKQFAQSVPETFTMEKSKEIMQTYANDIKITTNGELKTNDIPPNKNKKKSSF